MEAYIAETDIKCAVHKPSLSDLMFCNIISIAVRNMSQNLNVFEV
jgi:hypothetical protein